MRDPIHPTPLHRPLRTLFIEKKNPQPNRDPQRPSVRLVELGRLGAEEREGWGLRKVFQIPNLQVLAPQVLELRKRPCSAGPW